MERRGSTIKVNEAQLTIVMAQCPQLVSNHHVIYYEADHFRLHFRYFHLQSQLRVPLPA